MAVLALSRTGEIILDKQTLEHLGVEPGGTVSIELVPGGAARIAAAEVDTEPDIEGLFGLLKKDGEKPLSLEEINEIASDAWAGRR